MRPRRLAHVWLIALVLAAAAAAAARAAADDRQECLSASKETAAVAIAACTRAIESGDYHNGELSDLYHHRGYSWSWTGLADRTDRAFKDYTEAIRLEPKAVGSLLNRSAIYNARQDYDRAIADVNRAFEGDLSDYGGRVAYDERGYAYQAEGDYSRAIADYSQSIRLNATNYAALMGRGNAYRAKGDLDRAVADYDRVIALYPNYARAYYSRCVIYRDKGDLDRAIADCGQAITLYPQYRDAYYDRGEAYQAKGDGDRAVADYDQILALDPNDSEARGSRATAYLLKGDLRRAIADFGLGRVLLYLATVALLAAAGWLCSRAGMQTRRRGSGRTMIEACERQIGDLQHRNAALERIVLALENHSSK